ncbi:MAG: glycoside hydrolase family 20 zincin-like fold domain-containing protein [Tepidisphaeraceae bacterium]
MPKRICVFALLVLMSCRVTLAVDAGESLRLVPFPREVKIEPGRFRLDRPLVLEAPAGAKAAGVAVCDEFRRAGLAEPALREAASGTRWSLHAGPQPTVIPAVPGIDAQTSDEAYGLVVTADCVVAEGHAIAGSVHALNTLVQLIRANRQESSIPCVTIRDWPSLRWRAFQDDLTRGPSSTLETLKNQAALGAMLKLNLMTYYMEYQYEFRKHPEIGPRDGSMSADDLRSLVAFARPLGVEILGNQQSFGHWGAILKHPQYANLRENGEVLTPVREETYALLDDLYSEVIPHLPLEFFNVCCDETEGLGTGSAKELAKKIGVGGVYAQHLRRLHDLLHDKYGKRMMMWGDIILQHPDHLQEIPRDTIMLTWGYGAEASFERQIIPFSKSGYEFFACPGVSNWNRILPDFATANVNIHNFVRDGARHGAMGMLNTDWLDDGEGLKGHKWHGMAWGAECAWNASTTPVEQFNRRIGAVLFGEKEDHFGQAIILLSQPGISGLPNQRFWDNDFAPRSEGQREAARELLAAVQPAIAHLEICRKEASANLWILDSYLHGARRIERLAQRVLDGWEAAEAVRDAQDAPPAQAAELLAKAEKLVRSNAAAHALLGRRFAELWLAESRPYALDWTMRRYDALVKWYDELAGRIAKAREVAASGKRPPGPREIGLMLPRAGRLAPPDAIVDRPLLPEATWVAPATERLGLEIEAGSADRLDLPVEIELALPVEQAQPIAAWRVDGARPVVMAAQLDAAGPGKKSRLTLVVPGRISAGKAAAVQVYLKAASANAPAVKVTDAPMAGSGSRMMRRAFCWAVKGHICTAGKSTRPAGGI